MLLAYLLQLERPYWVPVSCLAVIQGATLRAAWVKQVHRIALLRRLVPGSAG